MAEENSSTSVLSSTVILSSIRLSSLGNSIIESILSSTPYLLAYNEEKINHKGNRLLQSEVRARFEHINYSDDGQTLEECRQECWIPH